MVFKFILSNINSSILKYGLRSSGSRSSSGRLTLPSRAGFKFKCNYRYVDYFRKKKRTSVLLRLDFDSFRNRYLGLVFSFGYGVSYFGLSSGWKIGSRITDHDFEFFGPGSCVRIGLLASGLVISSIHSEVFRYAKYVRAVGSKSMIVSNDGLYGVVCKLPSGRLKRFSRYAMCVSGNVLDKFIDVKGFKRAGFFVNRGYRPKVRGVAKNPVDHPHGGGEGKKSPPASSKSPWGWMNIRRKSRLNFYIIGD